MQGAACGDGVKNQASEYCDGTALDGKLFHPEYGRRTEDCDEDHTYVTLWVKVPNADIATQREEAARQIDAEAAAKAAAETERAAALAEELPDYVKPIGEDEDEGTDELTTDEVPTDEVEA